MVRLHVQRATRSERTWGPTVFSSRISATTGLTRREVTRLERQPNLNRTRQAQRSPINELFTRWL